ncbi:MAG: zinc ribbon domain-containing protein [Actinobacteria bacterium]|nr:zinc ribbon domain-containing protein [Actinomycetota bacterium]
MAVYEFSCVACGPFEEGRPMAAAADPARCPRCGRLAARVFGFHTTAVAAAPRQAREREERSREAPRRASAKPAGAPHRHAAPSRPWAVGH